MAKNSRTVVNDYINKTTTENINKTAHNTQNTNTHFDVNKTTNTNINGNDVGGRSVTEQDSGNVGLQCYGMKPGDPACVMHTLQNLEAQPIELQILD